MINPATRRSAPEADATAMPPPASRRAAVSSLVWAVPAVVTAALGLYQIGVPMLWRDELATWSATSRSLPQLYAMLHHTDAVLGVYYFGLHLWMNVFGDSATAMRLPSVIAMTGAAAVVALTGKRLAGAGAGLAGGLVFAVIPSASRYAQEARPYAFAAFFAALATLLLLRALERPSWQRWGMYTLALAAAGASNLVALCVLVGHAVFVLAACWQRTARLFGGAAEDDGDAVPPSGWIPATPAILAGFGFSAVAAVILNAPILIEGHKQSFSQIGQQPTPSLGQLLGLSGTATGPVWPQLFTSTPVAIAVIVLAVASVGVAPRRALAGCVLAGAVLPIAAIWLISQGPASYWVVRYLLFTLPAWALSAGLGIDGIAQRVRSLRLARLTSVLRPHYAVAAGLVVAVGLLGAHDQWAIRQVEAHNQWAYPAVMANGQPVDYPGAAAVIAAHQRPGDGIVFQISNRNHYQVDTSVAYYLRGKPQPKPVFQAKTQAEAGRLQPVECARPASCLSGTPRLWVVWINKLPQGTYLTPLAAIPSSEAAVLRQAGYRTQALYKLDGITVALLVAG
jgi:mannosyltransferase